MSAALLRAVRKGSVDAVAALLDAEVIVGPPGGGGIVVTTDHRGWAPLHVAALRGHVDVAALLVARGASVDCPTRELSTPLIVAAYNGRAAVAAWLMAEGKCSVGLKNSEGMTARDVAVAQRKTKVVAAIDAHVLAVSAPKCG